MYSLHILLRHKLQKLGQFSMRACPARRANEHVNPCSHELWEQSDGATFKFNSADYRYTDRWKITLSSGQASPSQVQIPITLTRQLFILLIRSYTTKQGWYLCLIDASRNERVVEERFFFWSRVYDENRDPTTMMATHTKKLGLAKLIGIKKQSFFLTSLLSTSSRQMAPRCCI